MIPIYGMDGKTRLSRRQTKSMVGSCRTDQIAFVRIGVFQRIDRMVHVENVWP